MVTDVPSTEAARRTVEAVWRMEAPKLIAGLARVTGDLGEAEELAQEAFVVALEQWPTTGIPPNPAGWLTTTAKNRAIDAYRKQAVAQRKLEMMGRDAKHRQDSATDLLDERADDHIGDDLLRMVFTACHPALSMEVRVALTLRCVGGLTTEEIARAFLVSTATAAQRIVRAKRTLTAAGLTFRMPTPEEMSERLAAVLEVVYLMFNEGYSATAGADLLRPALSEEAVRLGRVLASLIPEEPEVHGLLALMELQASRTAARTGPAGVPVLLADQDRRLWDRLLIRRGLASLTRAETLGRPIGPYTLQAGIAACHARADSVESTDWARIVSLYDALRQLWDSPVVDLNRAVAVGMSEGPAAGLAAAQAVATAGSMRDYPHVHLVLGEMLSRLGRSDEARAAFDRAAELTHNEQQRALFSRRADEQR